MQNVYYLDLQPEPEAIKQKEEVDYLMSLNSFSLFKIKSLKYLLDFPLTFMIRIMEIWKNIINQNVPTKA